MSLFVKRTVTTADQLIPPRYMRKSGSVHVTDETALRHSAVWACLRLRANLISTMPVDLFRHVNDVQVELPKPVVLVNPGGDRLDMQEWLYSTQFDLDRAGNCFGIIAQRDGLGFPSRINLVPLNDVTVQVRKGVLEKYLIGGEKFDPDAIWHERQYTVAGLHVGLSPVAYAAWSIGEYLSIQEFALEWFGHGGIPAAQLKNTSKTLTPKDATLAKERFRAAVANRDLFVTGADWDYKMIQAESAGAEWIEAKNFSVSDIARFFDVPGDLIDAAVSSGNITYANVTQRNLQFLIMHLGPAIIRRENALSKLTSRPRFVKLNTDALLRMDPQSRAQMFKTQIDSRTLAPSEIRELENRPPLTEDQMAEFDRLFGAPRIQPTVASSGITP